MSQMSIPASVLKDAEALVPELVRMRHAIHRAPELGLELPKTQQQILDWLEPLGFEVSTGESLSSVTAVLRGSHPSVQGLPVAERTVVLLRADMDALPINEKADVPYASELEGRMHACGHDLHATMLAGAATLLAGRKDQLAGDVVLMFQPGEEGFDGAAHMIEEGVLEAAGKRANAAYGIHVLSADVAPGVVMTRPGPMMSAADSLTVTVIGRGGHGSSPSQAKDPVLATAEMVIALQTMVTREFSMFDPVVISVGVLHAGTNSNIIPETAMFEATVRSFSRESSEHLQTVVPKLIKGVAAAHGLDVDVRYETVYPALINDDVEAEFVAASARELFGSEYFSEMKTPIAASEDFSRVLHSVPGAYALLSAVPSEAGPGSQAYNHSPYAIFDDSALSRGAALHTYLALKRLSG